MLKTGSKTKFSIFFWPLKKSCTCFVCIGYLLLLYLSQKIGKFVKIPNLIFWNWLLNPENQDTNLNLLLSILDSFQLQPLNFNIIPVKVVVKHLTINIYYSHPIKLKWRTLKWHYNHGSLCSTASNYGRNNLILTKNYAYLFVYLKINYDFIWK